MPAQPPRWTSEQLEAERQVAIARFREQRMREPLQHYLQAFESCRVAVERLLDESHDLAELSQRANQLLSDSDLLDAIRYLPGPPISADDLKILAEASLSTGRLHDDQAMAGRIVETVLAGLDQRRFPWVQQGRTPTTEERASAVLASAVLIASRRVMTDRAQEAKGNQEDAVKARLAAAGLGEVATRTIEAIDEAPDRGEFCAESMFAGRKADIVVRLWDGRAMPIECKVSNSSTNSVKRLNNDAAVKAAQWLGEFGPRHTVPTAVLAGVFKRHNLEQAQERGLTIFWAHDLSPLLDFIESTRPTTTPTKTRR